MGSSQRYGPPLFFAAWVPVNEFSAAVEEKNDDRSEVDGEDVGSKGEADKEKLQREVGEAEKVNLQEEEAASEGRASGGSEASGSGWLTLLGGGGGAGRSGVPNALLLAELKSDSMSLSSEPVSMLRTGEEAPYRMAVHPKGMGVVCSFPDCCRLFKWVIEEGKLGLASGKLLTQLDDGVMQLALVFNKDGTLLATGGEDGHLRVFEWSKRKLIIDENAAHKSVNSLDFSPDGKFLASVGDKDEPCRVWDLTSSAVACALPRENGESFRFCKFSPTLNQNQILYVVAIKDKCAQVLTWNNSSDPKSWKRNGLKLTVRDPVSAFDVSADGSRLALGTIEGEVIVASADMRILCKVKSAHLGFVTALAFKEPSVLLSSSIDATARVIVVKDQKKSGVTTWIFILILVLAILIYYLDSLELIPKIKF